MTVQYARVKMGAGRQTVTAWQVLQIGREVRCVIDGRDGDDDDDNSNDDNDNNSNYDDDDDRGDQDDINNEKEKISKYQKEI